VTLEMPFEFIREDQLPKLQIIFRELAPLQAAVVMAYLPPRLGKPAPGRIGSGAQTAIMQELGQTRQVSSDAVKEIEPPK